MIDPHHPDYENTPASDRRPPFAYTPADPAAPPLVTILTPFYKPGPVFHETAISVFRQSLQQFEWLIVNDATPDAEAQALLAEYRGRDPRIRVIDHQVNQGLSAARNTGVAAARSDYVILLDDDDLLEPTAAEKMYWLLETHPEFAACNGWEVGFGAQGYLWSLGFHCGAHILQENCTTGRAMVRCAAHRAIGGHDAAIRGGMEDWEYWLRLASHGLWGYTIPEYLDWYRRRENHQVQWENLDGGPRQRAFAEELRRKYQRLYSGGFPEVRPRPHNAFENVRSPRLDRNILAKPKPRLLMIIPRMSLGGAERAALELLKQLLARGWEVTVAALYPGDHSWAPEFERYTPDVFILPHFLRSTDYPAFLAHLVSSRRPEIVLASGSELGYLLLPCVRAVCPAPAYVDLCHSEAPHWKNGGYARYAAAYQDYIDLTLTTSQHLKDYLVERGADPARTEVLYLNVDAQRWRPCGETRARVRAELGLAPQEAVILFAGRLQDEKQPHVLAHVLQRLAQRGRSFRALIAGDGPERGWFDEFLRTHRLTECVQLLGDVPAERVRELMAAGDIFFLPSLWEGIALSIYEAMACGLAVVGANVGGQRELVTPECGLLLPRADAATEVTAYTDALSALLDDTPRRAELGRKARARIETTFALPAMAERFFTLLEAARQFHQREPRLVLPPRAAQEWAALAVEFVRINEALDGAWARANEPSRRGAESEARSAASGSLPPVMEAMAGTLHPDRIGAPDRAGARCAELERQLIASEAAYQQANARLQDIYGSTGWRVLQVLYRIRFCLFPRGSRRERLGRWCMRKQRRLRFYARQGPGPLRQATTRYLRRILGASPNP